jgi:hypothetical protein
MRRQITTTPDATRRFLAKVGTSPDPDGCWDYTGLKDTDGYGLFSLQRRNVRAHRYAYVLAYGPIPDGLDVLHSCDRPACVNPGHLRVGTNQDNVDDKVARGRVPTGDRNGARLHPDTRARGDRHYARLHPEKLPRGTRHGMAKVTDEIVRAIRARCAAGEYQRVVAAEYGIHQTTVGDIARGAIWKHVS